MNSEKISRRVFFVKTSQYIATASLMAPIAGEAMIYDSESLPTKPDQIILDLTKPKYIKLTRIGGAIKIPYPDTGKQPIIVCRVSDSTVTAFSSRCPHLACELSLPVNEFIVCPCHKSRFDLNGRMVQGPASENLHPFPASINGTVITITNI